MAELRALFPEQPSLIDLAADLRGLAALSYAAEAIETGNLPREDAEAFLRRVEKVPPAAAAVVLSNGFRVAVAARALGDAGGDSWLSRLIGAVIGDLQHSGAQPIETEEQLDELVAVARFIAAPLGAGAAGSLRRWNRPVGPQSPPIVGIRMQNSGLEQLLRDRPGDAGRIIEYVSERGMDHEQPEALDTLREWLDSQSATALADGWL